jgi:hypothetical protein
MPEGVGYGPQFTASTGLNLNYIGNRVYAFSGAVSVNNNETTLLEFTTGSKSIFMNAQFSDISGPDNYDHFVYINGENIFIYRSEGGANRTEPDNLIPLVIAPYTTVKFTAQNASDTSALDQFCLVTGKTL